MGVKRGDVRLQPGLWDNPVTFYTMVETQDTAGGTVRTPTLAYKLLANVAPYQGQELQTASREIGEIWATISIPYFASRIPIEGMRAVIKLSGETYEVRAVNHVDYGRKKVELTCRLVR